MEHSDLDHCPGCGRRITDFGDGCEHSDGQRFCPEHCPNIGCHLGIEPPDEYEFQLGAEAERQSERLREGWSP